MASFHVLTLAILLLVGCSSLQSPVSATAPDAKVVVTPPLDNFSAAPDVKTVVEPQIQPKVQPFALRDVTILAGPFKDAMECDLKYLLSLEPDRFLHGFRTNAGLKPKAEMYGGWEAKSVAGFSLGHYLSACAMAYATTGDRRFKQRTDYIVSELALCQQQRPDGYVSAIPDGDRIWKEIAQGDIRSQGFDLNGGWVPWYTMHKVMAGLIATYEQTGNEQAKTVVVKLADWTATVTSKLDDSQWQKMLGCEYGGMNESMAQIYAFTGNHKYLELSQKFNHKAILDPLSRGDASGLVGQHANTQIPKVIGSALQYELTGNTGDKVIAETFWRSVVHDHTYVIGGNSSGEHFGLPDKLNDRLTSNTCETCNTYNMLKLTRHLFMWKPEEAYMNYIERALYNHILASQNPKTGMMCYYVPLEPGAFKTYSSPTDSFWCCVGTGMENHIKYGESIYFHDTDSLYVNLFIASEVKWKAKGLTIRQENHFPQEASTRLTILAVQPTQFTMRLRYPSWGAGKMTVSINGKALKFEGKSGSYVSVARTWKSGDVVQIGLPMALHEEAMPDNPKRVALLYGPIVLAGTLGPNDKPKPRAPIFLADGKNLDQWIKPIARQPLSFTSEKVGRPQDVPFIPFYQTVDQRYSVYFDVFSNAEWQALQEKYRMEEVRLNALEAATIDFMQPGEMQPERDHNLQSDKSRVGEGKGRKWRDTADGGWISFDLKVEREGPQDLVLTYWGGESGNRLFDVLIDGHKIGTQKLLNNKPDSFFDVTHPLPAEMIEGKKQITVKLQAHPGNQAGGLFGARLVRRSKSQ